MKKELAIIILLALCFAAYAKLISCRGDIKEAERVRNRDYECVDLRLQCACSAKIRVEQPVVLPAPYPVTFTCSGCLAHYVLSKTSVDERIGTVK